MTTSTILRRGGLAGILATLLLATAAFAAGSANAATWHVEGKATESGSYSPFGNGSYGNVEVVVPARNTRIVCSSGLAGHISGTSELVYEELFSSSDCHPFAIKQGVEMPCVVEITNKPIVYSGTGSAVSSGYQALGLVLTGESCPLPGKYYVYAPSVSVTFKYKETHYQRFSTTASGWFAGGETEYPATVNTTHYAVTIINENGINWGWY